MSEIYIGNMGIFLDWRLGVCSSHLLCGASLLENEYFEWGGINGKWG